MFCGSFGGFYLFLQRLTRSNVATGHAMMGWSLGPATGKLVTEIINNTKPSMDLAAFHPDRKF